VTLPHECSDSPRARMYKRRIQELTAQLHSAGAAADAKACSSRATSPLPLKGPITPWGTSTPHDPWDPAALGQWEPGLLFPGPPPSIESLPLNFALPADWLPGPLPSILDWDPLALCTSRTADKAADADHPAAFSNSPRPAAPSSNGSSLPEGNGDPLRPKDPTRISNLRRRLQRIQITKQKLREGADPPPDHRQVAALTSEEAIAAEIAAYERDGTWSRVSEPRPRRGAPRDPKPPNGG